MTPQKATKAFDDCIKIILDHGPSLMPVRHAQDVSPYSDKDILEHVYWMCLEGKKLVEQNRMGKAMRWLGFVQGAMWSVLTVTITELKVVNRPNSDVEAVGVDGPGD